MWPDSFVEEANLTVNVSALRRLLGETAGRPSSLHRNRTEERLPVVASITEIQEAALSQGGAASELMREPVSLPVPQTDETPSNIPVQPKTFPKERFWPNFAILTLGLVLVVAAGAVYFAYHNDHRPPHRLAVLPFQNLRADVKSEFLGFSLADARGLLAVSVERAAFEEYILLVRDGRGCCKHHGNGVEPDSVPGVAGTGDKAPGGTQNVPLFHVINGPVRASKFG